MDVHLSPELTTLKHPAAPGTGTHARSPGLPSRQNSIFIGDPNGPRSLHTDPFQLHNVLPALGPEGRARLAARLKLLWGCRGTPAPDVGTPRMSVALDGLRLYLF